MARPRNPFQGTGLENYANPQLLNLANLLAGSGIAPERQRLQRERELAQQRANQYRQSVMGFNQAVYPMLANIGPRTQSAYHNAAQATDSYARGLAMGQQMHEQEFAGQGNALLAQNNSPQQLTADTGASNVLASLGALPAQGLEREGAAFTSVANMQPAFAHQAALRELARSRYQSEQEQQGFGQQLADLEGRIPGARAEALTSLVNLVLQGEASNLSREALGLEREQFEEEKRASRRDYQLALKTYQADLALALQEGQRPDASLSQLRGHFVDANGNDILDANGNTIPIVSGSAANAANKAKGKRENAVSNFIVSQSESLVGQLKQQFEMRPVGQEPVRIGTRKSGNKSVPVYAKRGGGETTLIEEAVMQTVYDKVEIPRPQYYAKFREIRQLVESTIGRQYGLKPARIAQIVKAILESAGLSAPASPEPPFGGSGSGYRGGTRG